MASFIRLQEAFIEHGGFQCGFCTPGMILACERLCWTKTPNPTEDRAQALYARQHLSLHRLQEDHRVDYGSGKAYARNRA